MFLSESGSFRPNHLLQRSSGGATRAAERDVSWIGGQLAMGSKSRIAVMVAAGEPRSRSGCQRSTDVSIFKIDTIELVGGALPQRQRRPVEAWAEIHQAELLAGWARPQEGRPPARIEPLR